MADEKPDEKPDEADVFVTSYKALQDKYKELMDKQEKTVKSLVQFKTGMKTVEESNLALQDEIEILQTLIKEKESESEIKRLKDELEVAQQMLLIRDHRADLAEMKILISLIDEVRSSVDPRILGMVYDLLEAAKKFEIGTTLDFKQLYNKIAEELKQLEKELKDKVANQ